MAAQTKELTPLMKQYWSVKSVHGDKIVLFRMGDFFEMFHDDAIEAAPILGIALTMRNKKSGDQTPMCGVPHHSIGGQINKLLQSGRKVAICDQVEDPKQAKGLVRREVTRVLTPGMVFDPETLDAHSPNYVASYDGKTLAFLEGTTGECFFYESVGESQLQDLLAVLRPVEIIYSSDEEKSRLEKIPKDLWVGLLSHLPAPSQSDKNWGSAQRLLDYVKSTQGESAMGLYQNFERRQFSASLKVSAKVLSHLEVFQTYRGDKKGSLFQSINRTRSAGGARLLRQWLSFPLAQITEIEERHQQVAQWTQKDLGTLKNVRQEIFQVGDLERRLGKVSQPQSHPRDLKNLAESVETALTLSEHFQQQLVDHAALSELARWVSEVGAALVEEVPANFREGGFINKGYHPILDELIDLSENSKNKIRLLEAKEKELTGISSLKIRYNNVFGFYIEVTNTHKSKVPKERYMRKQTLTNAERYVTEELSELEKKVITARTQRSELELSLFEELKTQLYALMSPLLGLARACNHLDAITSLAWLALEENYVRPQMQDGGGFIIKGSRHPVVEQLSPTQFVANDISLDESQCILLTGPNMAGKSTLMRQVALTTLMAQAGSFVPAQGARLPVVDKMFTRIGASDHLSEGLSTFMVEMQETAEMLQQATPRSLVILDEVGRGTSTYDGMSLAQAILEYFLKQLKSYTLFATHYHELTDLAQNYPQGLINKHMAIHESGGELLFRYHLSDGPAHKSYGIQVARLAGLPKSVVQQAQKILKSMEMSSQSRKDSPQLDLWQSQLTIMEEDSGPEESVTAHSLSQPQQQLLEAIQNLEIQKLTPLDALNQLAQWQQELS
jgi:DNA mismatch repair protein MutS